MHSFSRWHSPRGPACRSLTFLPPAWARTEFHTLSYTTLFRSTEPTGRVERARIILAYLDDPSAYAVARAIGRSEEHTSELQSHHDLVCRLLLEKIKTATEVLSSFIVAGT